MSSKKKTENDELIERSLAKFSVEEKLEIYETSTILKTHMAEINPEIVTQETQLNISADLWRKIRGGGNFTFGVFLHIVNVLEELLGVEKSIKIVAEVIITLLKKDKYKVKLLIEYLNKFL